jgi:subtilisin family serine protease
MNRKNFLAHVAIALTLVLVAGFAGQLRRWEKDGRNRRGHRHARLATTVNDRSIPSAEQAEVLVKFENTETAEEINQTVLAHHDLVTDRIESLNDHLVAIDDLDDADPAAVAAEYRGLPGVEYAEPNYAIHLIETNEARTESQARLEGLDSGLPNDPQFADQWSLVNTGQDGGTAEADISALKAWTVTHGDNDVVIAVLDSGVDYNHVDLRANMWTRPDNLDEYYDEELGTANDLHGFNAVDNLADPMDDNGHGTHCAGIIGAEGDNQVGIAGVNWHVRIMPLKFIDSNGSGTTKDAIEAINYVIERKRAGVNVRVISASWGSRQRSAALEEVIRQAGEEGITIIAAAGNNGVDTDQDPHYPSSYELPNVISVAATDRNDELATFSNFGKESVDVAAPGVDVVSTWMGDEFRSASGTSMATPVVSGVAGLILATDPNISMADLRTRLLDSVDKLPALKNKVASGGRINAAKAVGGN